MRLTNKEIALQIKAAYTEGLSQEPWEKSFSRVIAKIIHKDVDKD